MLKILKLTIFLFFLNSPFYIIKAEENKINLHFFHRHDCFHCAQENIFLEKLENEKPHIKINKYEVSKNQNNQELLKKFKKKLNINIPGVPVLFIENTTKTKPVIGFLNEETTGKEIKKIIKNFENNKNNLETKTNINIPILGDINIKNYSLPILTIIIAGLDGFNPCAMWILLFLISLLLQIKNKKKLWILGFSFIITSGLVYFLFLTAWLNVLLFIGFENKIRIIIGLIACGSSYYYLKKFYLHKTGCIVENNERRKNTFQKIKNIINQKNLFISLIGIILLAASVNILELFCSAGLPTVYTQILALSDIPSWQYYAYLWLYIIIFIIDDLFIFIIAIKTLNIKGISSKYTHYTNLIGGIVMLIIGILLIFKPQLIMLNF